MNGVGKEKSDFAACCGGTFFDVEGIFRSNILILVSSIRMIQ